MFEKILKETRQPLIRLDMSADTPRRHHVEAALLSWDGD